MDLIKYNNCKFCNKEFSNLSAAVQHFKSKKHYAKIPERLQISGFPENTDRQLINNYFSEFGEIYFIIYLNDNTTIELAYKCPDILFKVAHQDHVFNNNKLTILFKELVDAGNFRDNIFRMIKTTTLFDEEVDIVIKGLLPNNDFLTKCNVICEDIKAAIIPAFSKCEVHVFGSVVTGLFTKFSDIDIYLSHTLKQKSNITLEFKILNLIRNKLAASEKFTNIIVLRSAKVPIIKCNHKIFEIKCDLNIKNLLAVHNSRFIKHYLNFDIKLKPLLFALQYWISFKSLFQGMSKYALTNMLIFYLQQKPFSLPSVHELQKNIEIIEDGWNCGFDSTIIYKSAELEKLNLFQLFKGFFQFYANYDFDNNIICPYLGKSLKKTDISNKEMLPTEFQLYKNKVINKLESELEINKPLVVQDPFEHKRNITVMVSERCFQQFFSICNLVEIITQNSILFGTIITKLEPRHYWEYFIKMNSDIFKGNNTSELWYLSVVRYCEIILTNIFICNIINKYQTKDQIVFEIRTTYDVIFNCRQKYESQYKNLQLKKLDNDIEITKCLYTERPIPLNIFFNITLINLNTNKVHLIISNFKQIKNVIKYIKEILKVLIFYLRYEIYDFIKLNENSNLINVEINPITEPFESKVPLNNNIEDEKIIEIETIEIDKDTNVVPEETKLNHQENASTSTKEDEILISNQDTIVLITDQSDTMSNSSSNVSQQQEDDVPDDFFDDFSNQDFMAGLDIVDAWDDGEIIDTSDEICVTSNKTNNTNNKENHKSPHRTSKVSHNRSNSKCRRSIKSHVKSKELRRDPEKTRRDIYNDKMKCARDKEQKIVSDKLKIVETGLVPPGTEMDLDMESIKKLTKPTTEQRKSSEKRKISSDKSPIRYAEKKHRTLSKERKKYSRSPIYYSSRKNRDRRRRSDSFKTNSSERELWLRKERKRSRSREDCSTKKINIQTRKSFLEEIRDKLNNVHSSVSSVTVPPQYNQHYSIPNMIQGPLPVPAPMPVPLPVITSFIPQASVPQYDQNFFIGESYAMHNSGQHCGIVPQVPNNSYPVPAPSINQQHTYNTQNIEIPVTLDKNETIKEIPAKPLAIAADIDKLFADKKISLSDFLSLSAKSSEVQSSSSFNLEKKIKVINRCQDALKLLTKEKKFSGGLFVKSSNENRVKNDIKYQSPLRKIPVVRFGYTTPIKVTEEYDTYTAALDKLMKRLGIPRDVGKSSEFKEDINNKQTSGSTISSVDENIKTIEQQQQQKQPVTNLISEVVCNECKKRKSLVYTDAGTQCEDMKFTFSVSTQVTEEDINFMKGKKESLALLTPAQLLEKEKNKDEDGREASTSTSTVNASNSSNEASTSKCGMKRDSNEKKSSSSFFKKMDDHTYRRGPDSLFNRQRNYTNFDGYPPYFNENRQAEFHNQSQYSPPSIGNYSRFSPPPIYRMPHPPRDEYYNDFYYNNYRNPPDPHNRYGYEF